MTSRFERRAVARRFRPKGRGHCRAARLGLQFFHLPQGAVAIEAIGGLALGSTGD
jgi:hypothetical protein